MLLMVSGCHVGAQLDGHQHGVSIQISIKLGKTFVRISSITKFAATWILAEYLHSYLLSCLWFWTVSIERFYYYFDLFWMAWLWKPAIVFIQLLNTYNGRKNYDFQRLLGVKYIYLEIWKGYPPHLVEMKNLKRWWSCNCRGAWRKALSDFW